MASVRIAIGADIQAAVDAHPGNTTFCLERGVHKLGGAITPRTGNVFVGEYGAVLDGSGWTSADANQGAFRAQDQNVDNVTIRNLVIRRMPQKGIHAFPLASGWTIEHNEVAENRTGIAAPERSLVRHNYIHHNTAGGYSAFRAVGTTFESNEIAYNGGEQKIVQTRDVVFRNNFVHHNVADGIWYDAENTGSLIEGNRVEDNGREGISYEISGQGVIRHNVVRRNATTGIFISTSKDVEISSNTIEDNLRGIQYLLELRCAERWLRPGQQHGSRQRCRRRLQEGGVCQWPRSSFELLAAAGRAISERQEESRLSRHTLSGARGRREVLVLGIQHPEILDRYLQLGNRQRQIVD